MTSLLFSRRNLVLSAATAMAVFGLDGSLAVVEVQTASAHGGSQTGLLAL